MTVPNGTLSSPDPSLIGFPASVDVKQQKLITGMASAIGVAMRAISIYKTLSTDHNL